VDDFVTGNFVSVAMIILLRGLTISVAKKNSLGHRAEIDFAQLEYDAPKLF
jgi:hypothetical protein